MNFARLFEDSAERNPGEIALIGDGTSLAYAELDAKAARCAAALQRRGIGAQETVVLLSRNSIPCIEVMLGCLKANIITCPVNTRLAPLEVEAALKEASVAAVAFDRSSVAQAAHLRGILAPSVTFIALDDDAAAAVESLTLNDLIAPEAASFRAVTTANGDAALTLFTSGTTGLPKAVVHTHQALATFMAMFGYSARHSLIQDVEPTRDVVLGVLPLCHISGLMTLYALISGGTVVLQDEFRMEKFLDAIAKYRVTRTTVPSTVIEWMLAWDGIEEKDLSSLVELSYGGSPISRSAIRKATKILSCSLAQAYGSTESLIVTVLAGRDHLRDPNEGDKRAFSVGKPMLGAEVKIVDEQGAAVPDGVEGEIVVKSPTSFAHYRGKTRQESGYDEDGWLPMGDTGYIDENGFLYVTGRKRDLILSGGENIYPREVENCIALLENDVADVAVVGAPHPKWGETPVAFVVRKEGSLVTQEAVIAHCEERIAHYKRPSRVVFLEALPKDPLGKVMRRTLKERLTERMYDYELRCCD